MIPPSPLRLFAPNFADQIDASTQVSRMPGTADAPCLCGKDKCEWPWCVPERRSAPKGATSAMNGLRIPISVTDKEQT